VLSSSAAAGAGSVTARAAAMAGRRCARGWKRRASLAAGPLAALREKVAEKIDDAHFLAGSKRGAADAPHPARRPPLAHRAPRPRRAARARGAAACRRASRA
jgi:hypothetical protein